MHKLQSCGHAAPIHVHAVGMEWVIAAQQVLWADSNLAGQGGDSSGTPGAPELELDHSSAGYSAGDCD